VTGREPTTIDAAPLTADGRATALVIEDEAGWDAIARDWAFLHARARAATPLDRVWLRTWWRVYRSAFHEPALRIVTIWRSRELVGALPLFVHGESRRRFGVRHLRMLSTGEAEFEETCPDHLNLLALPGEEELCATHAWQAIDRMSWDHLELLDLDDRSALLAGNVAPSTARRFPRGTCPVADLTGGFESYLRRLSSNGRAQARRLLREGERACVQFEMVRGDCATDAFCDLILLHQNRWERASKPGVFVAQRFVEFHRALLAKWTPTDRAVLARLSIASGPVAVLYGFVTGSTFEFYQSGVMLDAPGLRSAGNLCHLLLMKALAERGIATYDFLRGAAAYKKRLATHETRLSGIEMWRPTLRTTALRSAQLALCAVRAACRRWSRPLTIDRDIVGGER
jgi:CelD/BcsL family acetyltransferase involved in cellulose biosynthesis